MKIRNTEIRILYEISFQKLINNIIGKHNSIRHESAIYITGMIVKLQNAMKF